MSLVLKNESHVPPGGGFVMVHPESGARFKKHYVDGVIALYLEHCEANGFPLPSKQDCIDLICKHTPANICYDSDEPPFIEKAVSFIGSMARWAASGFKVVSDELLQERLSVCQACPYWGGTTGGALVGARCGKCGCNGLKLAIRDSVCPLKKWL